MDSIKHRVKLRQRVTSVETSTIHLDWSLNGKRNREPLGIFVFNNPKGVLEKRHNKDSLIKANLIRQEREIQYFNDEIDDMIEFKKKKHIDFYDFFQTYIDSYSKKDLRMMISVRNKLLEFAPAPLISKEINEGFCYKFKEFLSKELNGESPSSYFSRFKKVLRQAYREKILKTNPAIEIKNFKTESSLSKEILTIEELKCLKSTLCGNEMVKMSFLFACNTGFRFADIKKLKWSDVKENAVRLRQGKTEHYVSVSLNNNALQFLPEKAEGDSLVFLLPSHTATLKSLRNWVNRAGIEKHITYHCARHSFGSLLAYYETDVAVISKLLGHTSLKHTMKYVRIGEEMKKRAVESLPDI